MMLLLTFTSSTMQFNQSRFAQTKRGSNIRCLWALNARRIAARRAANMVFTQGRGFVVGASFGLKRRSLRCRVLVCNAADTASLATRVLFGKLMAVATFVGFGEKRCRKNLPLCDLPVKAHHAVNREN